MLGGRTGLVAVCGLAICVVSACNVPAQQQRDDGPDITVPLPLTLPTEGVDTDRDSTALAVDVQPVSLRTSVHTDEATPPPDVGRALVADVVDAAASADRAAAREVDQPKRLTFVFTGDTLVHSPLVNQARANAGGSGYDFSPMFARIAPIISAADLAICHLETPIAPAGSALSTYPLYGVPAEITTGLRSAGYDRCSTASNHSLDRGEAGVDATVDALEDAGMTEAGMARSADDATVALLDVDGVEVAHLSYAFGFNGIPLPANEPWLANLIDVNRIIADATDARARGAQIVIVSLHWGREGSNVITPQQQAIAEQLTASGVVDLIVGHHVHVIQPIEQINGKWVVFGMGDFLSNMPSGSQWPASTQDGEIVNVAMTVGADGTVTVGQPDVVPTWVDRTHGWVIRDVLADLADPSIVDATRSDLLRSLARTASVVGDYIEAH